MDYQTIIIGAGPVGLLLATALGTRGIKTLVVDKRTAAPEHSMAIGITPPSLHILGRFGLDDEFIRRGVRIDTAIVHEEGDTLGEVSFANIPSAYRFILSLPQSITIRILQDHLQNFPSVSLQLGMEFCCLKEESESVHITLRDAKNGNELKVSAKYLIGSDGHRSAVRDHLHLPVTTHSYGSRFLMGDFEDHSGLGEKAHLFFNSTSSVESFPLPDSRRRWIILDNVASEMNEELRLIQMVRTLTGHDLASSPCSFLSNFQPKRLLANRFWRGRSVLCGDAAHVMSPIGGQGMNTGFADAELLGELLPQILSGDASAQTQFAYYDQVRREAFRIAANRAARGMWLGTRTGMLGSRFRRAVIRHFLFRNPLKKKLPGYFAMLTIPRSDFGSVLIRQSY